MNHRPSWDEYWMSMARLAQTRSTCLRRRVGAIMVRDNWLLTMGYNGAPMGIEHCEKCIREELKVPSGQRAEICKAVHAEQNAIIEAAKHGVVIEGATIYTTASPCNICAKMLINVGIKEVIFEEYYPDEMTEQLFSEAGITYSQHMPLKQNVNIVVKTLKKR